MPDSDATDSATPAEPPPSPATRWQRFRRYVTWTNALTLLLLAWVAPRLLPHLGAVVGVESGPATTPAYAYVGLDGEPLSDESLRGRWCS